MPLFPYPPDPSQDLMELFGRSKRRDTVRDAGYTSISPGEGALEVRDASGAVIGGVGNLPDGTMGLGIRRGGRTQNMNTAFDADFHDRDRRLEGHDALIADAGKRLAGHDDQIGKMNAATGALFGSVGAQLGDASNRIDAAWRHGDTALSQAASLRDGLSLLGDRVAMLGDRINALEKAAGGAGGGSGTSGWVSTPRGWETPVSRPWEKPLSPLPPYPGN